MKKKRVLAEFLSYLLIGMTKIGDMSSVCTVQVTASYHIDQDSYSLGEN